MDRRFLTVLGVSLLFALVISIVFYQMTSRAGGPPKAVQTDLKDVVLSGKALGVGVMVKATDVKIGKIAAVSFPKGAFSKVEDVIDRPVISNILLDEPILEGRLAVRGSGLGLAPIIPVGMRAVAVRVNDVAGVAGFVLPGMRVDVLVTGRPPDATGSVTSTVLQNIFVLSAGTTIQADARGQAIQAPTVTLLVSPDQAETLTLANMEGHIQLVLRNGSDQTIEKTPGREVSELYGLRPVHTKVQPSAPPPSPRPRPVLPPVPPPPPPPPDQVIVIRGIQRTVETVGSRTDGSKPEGAKQ